MLNATLGFVKNECYCTSKKKKPSTRVCVIITHTVIVREPAYSFIYIGNRRVSVIMY